MRRCFRAPEGRKLIDADYSQIELRILADFTGDRGFVDAFTSGVDLHRATAAQVFNVEKIEDVTKEQLLELRRSGRRAGVVQIISGFPATP